VITIRWTNNDKKLKDSSPFCGHFHFFIERIRWNLLQYVKLKIHMIFSIHHIFCINYWWITKKFLKVYKFYQILCFVLKNYPNFKLYQNMLTILCFIFLFHKLQLSFGYHVHYTLFTCGKGLLNLKIFFNRFLSFKIFQFHNLWVFFECGQSINIIFFFSHQNSFIKNFFSLIIYEIDYFWCNNCSSSKVLYENQNSK
jgi:hypothetical protein